MSGGAHVSASRAPDAGSMYPSPRQSCIPWHVKSLNHRSNACRVHTLALAVVGDAPLLFLTCTERLLL